MCRQWRSGSRVGFERAPTGAICYHKAVLLYPPPTVLNLLLPGQNGFIMKYHGRLLGR